MEKCCVTVTRWLPIRQQLPTFEYVFEHGITLLDPLIMDQVVQTISERRPEFELKLELMAKEAKSTGSVTDNPTVFQLLETNLGERQNGN